MICAVSDHKVYLTYAPSVERGQCSLSQLASHRPAGLPEAFSTPSPAPSRRNS